MNEKYNVGRLYPSVTLRRTTESRPDGSCAMETVAIHTSSCFIPITESSLPHDVPAPHPLAASSTINMYHEPLESI